MTTGRFGIEHSSAQRDVLDYALPAAAVVMTLAAPFITFAALGRGPVLQELRAATGRWLSLISLVITLLSPMFFISNYYQTTLLQYGVYSVLLSQATIMADRMGKRRALPPLLVWHSINLLNLIGGGNSLLLFYGLGPGGLIRIFIISPYGDCPDGDEAVSYCSDNWIAAQLLAGFLYLVLHILAFFIVGMRVAHSYGGEDDKPVEGVISTIDT
ncbi:unnamed protein product [Prorocentrum cordatum]|uniref:Uncharacterized protein n=1 Tax=Prorocentrum cordatum TaxID=2364126 RepID=A0ABN9T3R5_9DINO|nr:unnamed protein product [Polarella glacialis]